MTLDLPLLGSPPGENKKGSPSPKKIQISFYALSVLYAISYGSISTVNYYYVFGARPGASDASVEQANAVFELVNSLFPALWLIFLFLVPAFIDALRGPRNSFSLMMFAWAVAFCFLVGAFVVSASGPNRLIPIMGIMYSIFIGCFGGLGYTASESYLDLCAEWMPIALTETSSNGGTGGVDAGSNVDGSLFEAVDNHGEKLADAALHHKALASKYKNRFSSHLYAIIEVGSIVFSLPVAIGGDKVMLPLTIAISVCLFVGALGALFLYNIQLPAEHSTDQNLTENEAGEFVDSPSDQAALVTESENTSTVRNAFRAAAKSFISCFTCLSAYRWLAALAIVPYFFVGQFVWAYTTFIIQGDQCGLRDSPEGISIQGMGMVNLIGAVTQAITSFIGPLLVGPGKFQFKEFAYPMAIGYAIGSIGPVLVIALGGINDGLCGSYEVQIALQILNSIPFAINNSVGVAAVLCWYDGPYQHLSVAALASRSVWTQLGGVISAFVYTNSFGLLSGGIPCAVMTAVLYLFAAVCVPAAHLINSCQRANTDVEITVRRMSAGFISSKED